VKRFDSNVITANKGNGMQLCGVLSAHIRSRSVKSVITPCIRKRLVLNLWCADPRGGAKEESYSGPQFVALKQWRHIKSLKQFYTDVSLVDYKAVWTCR
jgi:hypothetical protein